MTTFLNYFLLFLIYSVIGWISETTFCLITTKKLVDRGFLLGPYCPIYGFGALIVTLYLEQYRDNIITVFLLSVILCSILEYITSYLLEKIFKARWWDYSKKKFNLGGRVCLENSIIFGIAGLIGLYLINPIITNLILKINPTTIFIISIISLIIFIIDTIISCNVINKLKITINNLELKDSTQEISRMVREKIKQSNKILERRLVKAFPQIKLEKLIKKEKLKELLNKK